MTERDPQKTSRQRIRQTAQERGHRRTRALGSTSDFLLDGASQDVSDRLRPILQGLSQAEQKRLLELYTNMDTEQRQKLSEMTPSELEKLIKGQPLTNELDEHETAKEKRQWRRDDPGDGSASIAF